MILTVYSFLLVEYQGCYEITHGTNFETHEAVRNVHECTSECLATATWKFAIAPNSVVRLLVEPSQANLCLRAFRHDKL